MFTIEGWNEIPSEIALAVERQGSPYGSWIIGFARLYSAIIVLVGGILGMSLANAVFVDEMTIDNNQDLERKIDDLQQQIAELKSLLENKA